MNKKRLLVAVLISLIGVACVVWQYSMRGKETWNVDSSAIVDRKISALMKKVITSKDPIAMYQLGVIALDNHDLQGAYVWYKLSSEYISQWALGSKSRKGEERFNESYLVMDIFTVQDEVNTNLPLIYSQLSKVQKSKAENILQMRYLELNAPKIL